MELQVIAEVAQAFPFGNSHLGSRQVCDPGQAGQARSVRRRRAGTLWRRVAIDSTLTQPKAFLEYLDHPRTPE